MAEVVIDTDQAVQNIKDLNAEIERLEKSNSDLAKSEQALAKEIERSGGATQDQADALRNLRRQQEDNTKRIDDTTKKIDTNTKALDKQNRSLGESNQSARNLARTFGGPFGAALADASEGIEDLGTLAEGLTGGFSKLDLALGGLAVGLAVFVAIELVEWFEETEKAAQRTLDVFEGINDEIVRGQRLLDTANAASIRASQIQLDIDRIQRRLDRGDQTPDQDLADLQTILDLQRQQARFEKQAAADRKTAAAARQEELQEQVDGLQALVDADEDLLETGNLTGIQRGKLIARLEENRQLLEEAQVELDAATNESTNAQISFFSTLSSGEQDIVNATTAITAYKDAIADAGEESDRFTIKLNSQAEEAGQLDEQAARTSVEATATKVGAALDGEEQIQASYGETAAILSTVLGFASAASTENVRQQRSLAIAQITIDAIASAAQAFFSGNLLQVGLIISKAAASIALISSTPIPEPVVTPPPEGFQVGGYTGYGGINEVAGVVHRGEYVVPANVLNTTLGSSIVSSLEGLRTGSLVGNTNMTDQIIAGLRNAPLIVRVKDINDELGNYVEVIDQTSY